MNTNDPYMAYYRRQQLQTGGGGINRVFRGAAYQKGHGVGSFLGGMFRTIAPILKSGAKTLGAEALKTGVGFLGDIAGGTTDPREAAGERFKQFTGSLKRKADEKLERVLRGGGAPSAKIRRVTRKRVARKSNARRAIPAGRRRRRLKAKVTAQSLAKLLRGRTSRKSNRRKKSVNRTNSRKKRNATKKKRRSRSRNISNNVRDIFN